MTEWNKDTSRRREENTDNNTLSNNQKKLRPTRTRDETMTRHEAIQQASLVANYLSYYEAEAYVTVDIEPNGVRIHYIHFEQTENEVERVVEKIAAIRTAESNLKMHYNKIIQKLSFNIEWRIDRE